MRKSNHHTLADRLQKMVELLDDVAQSVQAGMTAIYLLFTEVQYVIGRPIMNDKVLKTMALTYAKGAMVLAPSLTTRRLFETVPLGPARFDSYFIYPNTSRCMGGWFIPWRVHVIFPEKMNSDLERLKERAFLYCPSESELNHHIHWFEQEIASNSRTYQLLSIEALWQEETLIGYNSSKAAYNFYEQAINQWASDKAHHNDKVPKKRDSLFDLRFAPVDGQTVWQAWQSVIKTINDGDCLHRRGLLAIYRQMLEDQFFVNIELDEQVRYKYLLRFEANVTRRPLTPKRNKPGRWATAHCLDCYQASRILRHLVESFIQSPDKQEVGEAACAIWVMLWCSSEVPGLVTLTDVLAIRTNDLNVEEATIEIAGQVVEISDGLTVLLSCLRGRGTGERRLPLFRNLTPKSFNRILERASLEVLGEDAAPIAPSAFLTFPHVYEGVRMTAEQRRAMQNGRRMIEPRWTVSQIRKELENIQNSAHCRLVSLRGIIQ